MKSKILFHPEDLKGSGQLVIRNSFPQNSNDYRYASTVCYKVGYLPERKKNVVLLIAMSDGLATQYKSKSDLCDFLNNDDPGFRPMTDKEIRNIFGDQGSRFQV